MQQWTYLKAIASVQRILDEYEAGDVLDTYLARINMAFLIDQFVCTPGWESFLRDIVRELKNGDKNKMYWAIYRTLFRKYYHFIRAKEMPDEVKERIVHNLEERYAAAERKHLKGELNSFNIIRPNDMPEWFQQLKRSKLVFRYGYILITKRESSNESKSINNY